MFIGMNIHWVGPRTISTTRPQDVNRVQTWRAARSRPEQNNNKNSNRSTPLEDGLRHLCVPAWAVQRPSQTPFTGSEVPQQVGRLLFIQKSPRQPLNNRHGRSNAAFLHISSRHWHFYGCHLRVFRGGLHSAAKALYRRGFSHPSGAEVLSGKLWRGMYVCIVWFSLCNMCVIWFVILSYLLFDLSNFRIPMQDKSWRCWYWWSLLTLYRSYK